MEVVWIYYGFCGAFAYFVDVWISLFFPVKISPVGEKLQKIGLQAGTYDETDNKQQTLITVD
jgi:hypothetical protein